jgi:hypothetical protein
MGERTYTQQIKRQLRDLLPDWFVQIWWWRKAHGVFPKIIQPVTFNENVLHRMIFERQKVFTQISDKVAVRSYVKERLGPKILPKLYYLTSHPENIPFDELPERFVVKPTHGSGWIQIVTDKSTLNREALLQICTGWLSQNYYKQTREWHYKNVEPRIIVEEFIDDGSGTAPNDYKLFVFGGTVEVIQVDVDRFIDHRQWFYTPSWEKLDVRYVCDDISGGVQRPPAHLKEMIVAAEMLGRGWDFIRVDLYDTSDRLYFGELTLAPNRGLVSFRPNEFDRYLGTLWNVSKL